MGWLGAWAGTTDLTIEETVYNGPPRFVSASAFAHVGNATFPSGSIIRTLSWPAGHQADDYAMLYIECEQGDVIGVSSPWAFVCTHDGGSPGTRFQVYALRATNSAMADVTVSCDNLSTHFGDHIAAQMLLFRGAKRTGSPVNVIATGANLVNDATPALLGATTTVDNCLAIVALSTGIDTSGDTDIANQTFSDWAATDLSDFHQVSDHRTGARQGGGFGIAVGAKITAGAFAAPTVTQTTATQNALITICLEPEVTLAPADDTPPEISMISPASGSVIGRFDPITFRLSDETMLQFVVIWIKYRADRYRTVVYDGDDFSYPFDSLSVITPTGINQIDFSLLPVGGWRDEIEELRVRFLDAGNLDEE